VKKSFANIDRNTIGGGIVFDSDEYDEWMETMNKLGANMHCITSAENIYAKRQQK
jgi:anthranilate synthase component I